MKRNTQRIKPEKETELQRKLDFNLKNTTNKPLYVTCFYYAQKEENTRWELKKTDIYELQPNQEKLINIAIIPKPEDINDIYGYLAIFENKADAENSIFELLEDENKLELGRLNLITDHKVRIYTETYGIEKKYFRSMGELVKLEIPELDFTVENKTGKDLYVCCFAYQRHRYQLFWIYDKNQIYFIKNGESKLIDIDSIVNPDYRQNVYGYLGVFEDTPGAKEAADNATFETLLPDQKITLGLLSKIQDKKVVLVPIKYGLLPGFENQYPSIEHKIEEK